MTMKSELKLARFVAGDTPAQGLCFFRDCGELSPSSAGLGIVLADGGEERARTLLESGVARVLLGDLALQDSTAVLRLVEQYGGERVGVWLRAVKKHVSWSIDYVSNEDFNCLTPSVGAPGWELVQSDGTPTGADAYWWLGEMLALGATVALVSVDMQDDDLNICAGMVEDFGDKVWFTPWQQADINLEPWVRYGQVRQLLLPENCQRDETELARIGAAAMVAVVEEEVETV